MQAPVAAEARSTRSHAGLQLSDGMRIALAPARTYEALVASDVPGSWPRALAGPGFPLLVFATAASIAATRVASLPTVLTVAACWAFVPAVQLLTASRSPAVPRKFA